MCLDNVDQKGNKLDKRLFGPDEGRIHRRFDLNFIPCDHTKKECEKSLVKIKKYIGDATLTLLYNSNRMALKEYGDKSVMKQSFLQNMQFDMKNPNFFQA